MPHWTNSRLVNEWFWDRHRVDVETTSFWQLVNPLEAALLRTTAEQEAQLTHRNRTTLHALNS